MAKSNAVWGIDIGQCALKALRCRPHEKEPQLMVVEAFDYIEYPQILTQPEAEPEELVREALEQFVSRNELVGDSVCISVAGQSGLARFIKLPPVESKKIPDIVKYEARQQIPFALEDVVWDYQQLYGGSEEDGFALEPEVGIFAMKRDQVGRALEPLEIAGIEVDLIQLTPLAIYNYVCFDRFEDLEGTPYDPQSPPPSTVVISLGTDTTDLVVTNGYRVWQRNIPIGGNHFTRALSKELKLTFVKAEHLKRNATEAEDPKAVFQAMRPVFSDLLSEIQRSLGYFTSLDKAAKIEQVITLGNAMKLPGLQRYLSQNLEQEVTPIESFERLSGGSTTAGSQFKENTLSFAVAYGLCVQGLQKGALKTNLLPEEIVRTRLIRAKKPWVAAGLAALLAGLSVNYLSHVSAWQQTDTKEVWADAIRKADQVKTTANGYTSEQSTIHSAFDTIKKTGDRLVANGEDRLKWLELFKALDAAMPKDPRPADEREETAEDIASRPEVHISSVDTQFYEDLGSEYFSQVESAYAGSRSKSESSDADAAGGPDEEGLDGEEEVVTGPEGSGWVVQLTGYHYHNADQSNQTARFVNRTLIKNLEEGSVELPTGPGGELVEVPFSDFGISYPWVVQGQKLRDELLDPDGNLGGPGASSRGGGYGGYGGEGGGRPGAARPRANDEDSELIELKRYDFVAQFCWTPTTAVERQQIAQERAQAEAAAAEAAEAEALAEEEEY
ncbi:MAG: type IV pilus assembly protein PilM [Planctomycetota bacterium]